MIPAEIPALPLHKAGPYVAAAYVVFVVVLLVYLAIMAMRLVRNQREITELRLQLEARDALEGDAAAAPAGTDLPVPEARPQAEVHGEARVPPEPETGAVQRS